MLKVVHDIIGNNAYISYHSTRLKLIKTLMLMVVMFGFKGALSGLRQLWAIESPLKAMKNTFYFTGKDLVILKIFKFLS